MISTNPLQLNAIGTGVMFPIQLTVPKDSEGNPIQVPSMEYVNGEWVPKTRIVDGKKVTIYEDAISWRPVAGDPDLVVQNLKAIFTYIIGQKLREEIFGSRVWECIEEPNDDTLQYTARDFITSSIQIWEPRIMAVNVNIERTIDSLMIKLYYRLKDVNGIQYFTYTL